MEEKNQNESPVDKKEERLSNLDYFVLSVLITLLMANATSLYKHYTAPKETTPPVQEKITEPQKEEPVSQKTSVSAHQNGKVSCVSKNKENPYIQFKLKQTEHLRA